MARRAGSDVPTGPQNLGDRQPVRTILLVPLLCRPQAPPLQEASVEPLDSPGGRCQAEGPASAAALGRQLGPVKGRPPVPKSGLGPTGAGLGTMRGGLGRRRRSIRWSGASPSSEAMGWGRVGCECALGAASRVPQGCGSASSRGLSVCPPAVDHSLRSACLVSHECTLAHQHLSRSCPPCTSPRPEHPDVLGVDGLPLTSDLPGPPHSL